MTSLDKIKASLCAHAQDLRRDFGVEEIGVFGSYARGEQKKTSDVDIYVEFRVAPDLLRFIELERRLEDLLGVKVDLVRKRSIRKEIKGKVLREAVSI